jgi:hypothetical protein
LTNQLQKLKTTNLIGTKFDTPRTNNLSYKKFISEDAAALHFLKLFEFEFVRFFYSKVGLFKKAFRQIEAGGFGLKRVARWCRARKGYQSFQEHFVFEGFGSLFFVSE